MNQNKIIKLAGAIKPPAKKSEIIEALAIRKREQIITENKTKQTELEQLRKKHRIIALEEILAGGRPKHDARVSCYAHSLHDNSLAVTQITMEYACEPSVELREIARKIYRLERDNIRREPSLHEVRQQVRAALNEHTNPAQRVSALLKDAESSSMIDDMIAKLDGKPRPLALTA